LDRQTHKSIQ